MPDLLRAALAYAAHGWAVFPLRPGQKTPACEHGCKDATTDEAQVRAWWRECSSYGVGLATGSVSGICVVDLDGEPLELMRALLRRGPLPRTMATRTGSGGMHLIYRLCGARVPNSARRLAPGVDTRGEGGYIVAPPSLHPSGSRYELANELPTAPVPAWIVRALTEQRQAPAVRRSPQPAQDDDPIAGPVHRLLHAVNGERNEILNWAAYRLFASSQGDADEVERRLREAAMQIGLTEQETMKTIQSARRAALESP